MTGLHEHSESNKKSLYCTKMAKYDRHNARSKSGCNSYGIKLKIEYASNVGDIKQKRCTIQPPRLGTIRRKDRTQQTLNSTWRIYSSLSFGGKSFSLAHELRVNNIVTPKVPSEVSLWDVEIPSRVQNICIEPVERGLRLKQLPHHIVVPGRWQETIRIISANSRAQVEHIRRVQHTC